MSERLPITVTGGAGGVAASYDDLATLGRLYHALGADLADAAWHDRLEAGDADLVLSAVLAPHTFADAEAAILSATYGPRGLASRALVVEAQSFAFAAVVDLYRDADALQQAAYDSLSYGLGVVLGAQLVPVALTGGWPGWCCGAPHPVSTSGGPTRSRCSRATPRWCSWSPTAPVGCSTGSATTRWPVRSCEALGIDGLHLTPAPRPPTWATCSSATAPGSRFPTPRSGPTPRPGRRRPGRDLAATAEGADGALTVQRLLGADGEPRWVVHLPGTDAFLDDRAVRDMGANLDLIAGDDTAYAQATAARWQSGVGPQDPVMVVGHSQGGMQAAALAGDPEFHYRVTHVVTVGAPVATFERPRRRAGAVAGELSRPRALARGRRQPGHRPPHHGHRPTSAPAAWARATATTASPPTPRSPSPSTPATTRRCARSSTECARADISTRIPRPPSGLPPRSASRCARPISTHASPISEKRRRERARAFVFPVQQRPRYAGGIHPTR